MHCSGYAPPRTWLFEPKRVQHEKPVPPEAPPSWLSSLGDSKSLRAFQFFIEKTAPLFSAYLGHSFWTFHLPRVGLTFPAVKHVLLASSSLVELEVCRDGGTNDRIFAQHYGEAIKLLTKGSSSVGTESVLASALLFATCDFMEGDFVAGIRHLQSGVRILEEWFRLTAERGKLTTNSSLLITTIIAPIFASYNEKFPTYGLAPLRYRDDMHFFMPCPDLPTIPLGFISLVEARHCLDGISHHVVKAMESRLRKDLTEKTCDALDITLRSWQASFDNLVSKLSPQQRTETARSVALLDVHAKVLSINTKSALIPLDQLYRESYSIYKSILESYANLSRLPNWAGTLKCVTGKRAKGELEYHLGFIPPLYFTATTCPYKKLRDAALAQLATLDVVESNWNSCVAYTIAKGLTDSHYGGVEPSPVTLLSLVGEMEVYHVESATRQPTRLVYTIRSYTKGMRKSRWTSWGQCGCEQKMSPILGKQLYTAGYQGATKPQPLNCGIAASQAYLARAEQPQK